MKFFEKLKADLSSVFKKKSRDNNSPYEPIHIDYEAEKMEMPAGLTSEQVKKRTEEGKVNVAKSESGKSVFKIIADNTFNFFNFIWALVTVLIISVGSFENLTFLVIVGANLIIAIVQEIRAKITVEKLSVTTEPVATVVRDGELKNVKSTQIVLGDVMKLEIGRQVLSDSVVVSGICEVNESMLTGESNPIKKQKGDKIYAGTFLVSGAIYAEVCAVGRDNYTHQLEKAAKKFKAPSSNLFRDLDRLIKSLIGILVPVAILTAVFNWLTYKANFEGFELTRIVVEKTCGSIVGMIPSGIYLLVTLTLSLSVMALARKKTLVQDMYSIEMLASADILCLDKTGTITDGTMQVCDVISLSGESEREIEYVMARANFADNAANATSNALLVRFGKEKCNITDSIPFSSQRKFSAVDIEGVGVFAIGAPHFAPCHITEKIDRKIEELAAEGKRVLIVARMHSISESGEPFALIAIEDRIRPNAMETIAKFQEQDVTVKVISGDHAATVSTIAKKVGIKNAEKYISCENLTDEELKTVAEEYTVFGRVTPEQKVLIIKTLKKKGHTVAMTGDGVNDTLALKEANCAIAMADGSEVARKISQIVLMNSDFGTLPDVVREGRRCINNVRQSAVLFLMKTIFTICISVFSIITMTGYPFAPNNFLFLELFIIGIGSFLLALEPNDKRIVGSFLDSVFVRSIPSAISMLVPTLLSMIIGRFGVNISAESRNAVAMCVVTLVGFLNLIYLCHPYTKWRAAVVTLVGVLLSASFLTINYVPQLGDIFGFGFAKENVNYFASMIIFGVILTVIMHIFERGLQKMFVRFSEHVKRKKNNL